MFTIWLFRVKSQVARSGPPVNSYSRTSTATPPGPIQTMVPGWGTHIIYLNAPISLMPMEKYGGGEGPSMSDTTSGNWSHFPAAIGSACFLRPSKPKAAGRGREPSKAGRLQAAGAGGGLSTPIPNACWPLGTGHLPEIHQDSILQPVPPDPRPSPCTVTASNTKDNPVWKSEGSSYYLGQVQRGKTL